MSASSPAPPPPPLPLTTTTAAAAAAARRPQQQSAPAPSSSSSSSSRMPALLEPHVARGPLARDEGSLTVVTWVQGASANWLVLRYLYTLLGGGGGGGGGGRGVSGDENVGSGVVLVSFMRDARFWADGCARLGMDLDALRRSGRFSFVDGLTSLYAPPAGTAGRNEHDGVIVGDDGTTSAIQTQVEAAMARLAPQSKKTLILDGLDAYVATTTTTTIPVNGSSSAFSDADSLLMRLRENAHSTLVTLAADEPLIRAAVRQQQQQQQGTTTTAATTTTTGLERKQAALVLGQAHAADQVVSLRRLDTGAAADVSGVLRVATKRAAGDGGGDGDAQEEDELLYHVSGDGTVRVFERGA
ncbi:hypothetical protein V2A60_003626 [Cordyceps javanica]|uniref:Protein family UPF0405 n=1 Tax=Cordyceps javanica TaxID=43265 RepID=A0A545UUB9_9HYPO|nr:protein family UPF0405 [Cordyceps javanica]TQW04957.1 hypothetical protein IF2G_07600 [Cordyceps javanica]